MPTETLQLEDFAARKRKQKPGPDLVFPSEPTIKSWHVVAVDPSLTRAGFATSYATPEKAEWISVGSWKPRDSSQPVWARAAAIGSKIKDLAVVLQGIEDAQAKQLGLLFIMEAPPPRNDWLSSLQRVIFMMMGRNQMHDLPYGAVRVMLVNASTLRSQMALTKTGNNKNENIARAYDYIDRNKYPQLDSDSCDAVLLSVVGIAAANVLMGQQDLVPDKFRTLLCDTTTTTKGKGKMARDVMKGLLHNPAYFWKMEPISVELAVKDAKERKLKLERHTVIL